MYAHISISTFIELEYCKHYAFEMIKAQPLEKSAVYVSIPAQQSMKYHAASMHIKQYYQIFKRSAYTQFPVDEYKKLQFNLQNHQYFWILSIKMIRLDMHMIEWIE